LPTAEEASTAAHKLLTEASTTPSGVAQAPSGRQTRKHVCLHPGCGKVFHFKASADAHQTEHQFLERLATATPFTDQFLSTSWPSHGVPWIAKSPVPSSSSAAHGQKPSAAVSTGEVSARAHFTCEVPQCNRRFASSKLLGLHLRVGHSVFDLERMEEARLAARDGKYGAGPMITADGLPITRWVEVGRGLRARFVGRYRLVPPFMPPDGCPTIEACARHGWLKAECHRCQQVRER
ncbi:unnamed protein product, partial [Sphacelaria rigidula]